MTSGPINFSHVLTTKQPKVGRTRFIAIDGHGGSGKSSLATYLASKLNVPVIHTDDFASWDNPLDWWPLVIEQVFLPIQHGAKTLSYPRSRWHNHDPGPAVDQPVTDLMILEGVSSARKEFRDYISVSIFVDAPRALCLQRGVERDCGTGKTKEELDRIWQGWLEDEDRYIECDHPQTDADIIVDGTRPFEEQIEI